MYCKSNILLIIIAIIFLFVCCCKCFNSENFEDSQNKKSCEPGRKCPFSKNDKWTMHDPAGRKLLLPYEIFRYPQILYPPNPMRSISGKCGC